MKLAAMCFASGLLVLGCGSDDEGDGPKNTGGSSGSAGSAGGGTGGGSAGTGASAGSGGGVAGAAGSSGAAGSGGSAGGGSGGTAGSSGGAGGSGGGSIDECDTTQDCKAIYGSAADDCFNSASNQSVCHCGGKPCKGTPTGTWRVGYSADGNQHDPDDWHASPMALAVLHRAGLKSRLVHFDYNNHLGDNNTTFASNHKANITGAIKKFGYNSAIFFDDQVNLSGAVQSIANAINASSATDRFILICAGPMEVCWRGIDAAQNSKEQYVTVISHSNWNDTHQDTSQMSHTWSSISSSFNAQMHHINDQNGPAFKSSCSAWNWLKTTAGYGTETYDWVCTGAAAGDASDAGMMYYLVKKQGVLTGNSGTGSPTMSEVKAFFGG